MIANTRKELLAQRMLDSGAWTVDAARGLVLSRRRGGRPIGYRREYIELDVRDGKAIRQIFAHRVVWLAVHGPIADPLLQINHLNGIKTDNRIGNLELVTGLDNTRHAFATALTPPQRVGVASPCSKLSDQTVLELFDLLRDGAMSQSAIASRYGISQSTVSLIHRGKRYRDVLDRADQVRSQLVRQGRAS